MKKSLIILTIFLAGCCGPILTMSDNELKRQYVAFSPGRAIAHDVLWSAGGKSLQYAICRNRIAEELMKRGYRWDGHNWIK